MQTKESPYECHVFICGKTRDGLRKSCGDVNPGQLKALLKTAVAERGWKGRVRISDSGCLGLCDNGPNVIIYPQKIWFPGVTPSDAPAILYQLEMLVQSPDKRHEFRP
jgi:(2Fe-2S) ferredoxin